MYPLILVAKKRYMYVEWTNPTKHNGEIEAKGVELVRRDNCPYVKETLDRVLTPIMFENNVQVGKHQAELCIDDLLNGKVPIKKLILSKNLRSEYKGYTKKYLNTAYEKCLTHFFCYYFIEWLQNERLKNYLNALPRN
jgi:DNA polymerase elongation subunit (family B)